LELKGMPAVDTPAVHRWIFEHVVRTVPADFYLPDSLPRLRWSEHVAEYRRHVAAVTHPADFAELMGELLGELNASHTYFHYRRPPPPEQPAFSLGVVYAPDHEGPGWKIADVLHSGPLSKADPEIRAGDVIVQVDSVPVAARSDPARFLTRAPDAEIELTVRTAAGAERRLRVSPLDTAGESRLFYRRWLQFQARETDRLSGGRVGYVHMPAMEEEWFRPVVEDVLGSLVHKEALLLDTRFNSGGWIHEPLISFLAAPFAFDLRVRGTTYASEPALRAGRTFVVLVNRANYSNGFETPRLLREQGIARLVGEPMAGTGLGGSTDPLPYPEYSYSVAHDVTLTRAGELWEGVEQQPDVLVPADRNALRAGHDVQLAAAVQAVLADAQRKVAKGCEMGDPVYGCSNASPWLSEAQRDGISRTGVSRAH
jgi:C-terminal processing protease CtpA/Prc